MAPNSDQCIYILLNPFGLRFDREGWGLSTQCHSCGFACQQRVLKTFPGPGYLRSEDGVVWLWHSLVNLYTYIYLWQKVPQIQVGHILNLQEIFQPLRMIDFSLKSVLNLNEFLSISQQIPDSLSSGSFPSVSLFLTLSVQWFGGTELKTPFSVGSKLRLKPP